MNLTIFDTQSHQPVLFLTEDSLGMKISGGNKTVADGLHLQRFHDLKEVADYINSNPDGGLQAVFEGEGEEDGDNFDERLEPALAILRQLMDKAGKAQATREGEANKDEGVDRAMNTMGAQIQARKPQMIYVSFDGDSIGNAVARAEASDDESQLAEVSNRINAGQELFRQWAVDMGGNVVQQGGDEGLCKVPDTALNHVEAFRKQYYGVVKATCSVGIGSKLSEATKARELAKLRGKNQTCVFDDATEKELELRLEEKGDEHQNEAVKIRHAMEAPQAQGGSEEPSQAEGAQPSPVKEEESSAPAQQEEMAPPPKWASPPEQQQKVVQEDEKQTEEEPEEDEELPEEGDEQLGTGLDPEFLKEVAKKEPRKPRSVFRSANYDEEIENADFSEHEDPELMKHLAYNLRYGN